MNRAITIGQFRAVAGSAAARELKHAARFDEQQRLVIGRDLTAGARIAQLSAAALARAERADGYMGPA